MSYRSIVFGVALVMAAGCDKGAAPQPDTQSAPGTPSAARPMANNAPAPDNNATPTPAQPAPSAAAVGMNGAATQAIPLTDEQIALITNDANSGEIEQAKLAEQRGKDPRVKHFAEKMVKHHTAAKDKQAKLDIKTEKSPASVELEKSANTTLANLQALSGAAFDTAYMNAQVDEHQKVLDTLDNDLLPNVKGQALKSYLDDMKSTVENHLKDAQNIQRNLNATASAN
jgi:putative membrane protein